MKNSKDWMTHAEAQAISLAEHADQFEADVIVCEMPTAMGIVGRTSNSLGKLLYHVGYFKSSIRRNVLWNWYPVNTWKGSIPKIVMTKRVNKIMDLNLKEDSDGTQDNDIADAIGVGLYHADYTYGRWAHGIYFGRK
jgi:hypothetical protein